MQTNITVLGGEMPSQEIDAYLDHIKQQNPNQEIDWLEIKMDGDYVDLSYQLVPMPFERIRRVTGYLVGTVDRFNNAKRAEEHDRVKHM